MCGMPCTAASAPAMVVKVVTLASNAEVRIWRESAIALRRSSTVLMTSEISLFLIMSTMWGRPSVTLLTTPQVTPAPFMAAAVPLVASTEKPIATSARATSIARGLSLFLTDIKTLPEGSPEAVNGLGNLVPAPIWDFTNASPNVLPTPMTSPVDFISGPRIVSTPGNLTNGKTASFTLKYGGLTSAVMPWDASD